MARLRLRSLAAPAPLGKETAGTARSNTIGFGPLGNCSLVSGRESVPCFSMFRHAMLDHRGGRINRFGRVGRHAGGDRIIGSMQMIRRIFVPLTDGDGEVATLLADHDAAEIEAHRRFDEARLAVAAPLAEEAPGPLGLSARWLGVRPAERIVRDGGLSDLLVVGPQHSHDNPRPNAVRRAALITAGRPLLLAAEMPMPSI